MAWRFVTHACGHQERINVDGPYVVVEQRVRNAERVSCPACIGIASRQRNRLDGFCELWGSKSQCDRAEPIRRRTLSQVDVLARHARIEDRDAFAELRKQVLRMNDAAWWIEHKKRRGHHARPGHRALGLRKAEEARGTSAPRDSTSHVPKRRIFASKNKGCLSASLVDVTLSTMFALKPSKWIRTLAASSRLWLVQ
ncbi:hypothetical protein [Bifidobacterium pullorum]